MTDIEPPERLPIDAGAPALLLIHREAVPQMHSEEYAVIEAAIARTCRELGCPHPYLALETLSGEREVWFLNGFASVAELEEVSRRYLANASLMSALAEPSRRKAALVQKMGEHLASYRSEQVASTPWAPGRDRYLVIVMGSENMPAAATYEAPDGKWFTLEGAPDAETALARSRAAGAIARALAVRPDWSHPAPEWIRWDRDLWSATR